MNFYKSLKILFVISLPKICISINVLVYSPAMGASHTNFMARLADTLTEAGNNVTFLVPIGVEEMRNQLGVKLTKDVYMVEDEDSKSKRSSPANFSMAFLWTMDPRTGDAKKVTAALGVVMRKMCWSLMKNKNVLDDMKNRKFDVAILEPLTMCGLGFVKKLGIEKTILATSTVKYEFILPYIGEPVELSYVPTVSSTFTDQMSIVERYSQIQIEKDMREALEEHFDGEQEIYQKQYGKDISGWRELLPAASLYFTNSNPYLDFPRPVIQKTIPIGGIAVDVEQIRKEKLPEEWDEVLNRRNKTMLMSFGSVVKCSEMPELWRKNLLDVIKSFPDVTFIWKYDSDDTTFASGVDNIHFSKWFPQSALLADSRVTAFLTHGGLGSTNELAYFGKPALMIPLLHDQTRNANMLMRHGGVIKLEKVKLANGKMVREAVHSILFDERYKINSENLARILENQPIKPKELLLRHTEFVAKFGPFPQMDPYGRHLNYFQKNFLDVYAIICLVYGVVFLFSVFSVFYIVKRVSRLFNTKSKNE